MLLIAENPKSASGSGRSENNQKLLRGVKGGSFLEMRPPCRRRQDMQDAPHPRRQVAEAFKKSWSIADLGLEIIALPGQERIEMRSKRIFLDPAVVEAALKTYKDAQPVLTYFVNEIGIGNRATPYSFVSAPGTPIAPPGMKEDEIIINEWLARDLLAVKGDRIRLTYYVLGPTRVLREESAGFRVKKIVPLKTPYLDRELMPEFPGLTGEEDCRDWHPGIPVELDKIRDKDEVYWEKYLGTPKAFVTLKAAQNMWRNHFGDVTAIRFSGLDKKEIKTNLIRELDPALFGFVSREIKKEGLRAGAESVDFGQLFLGLSFFVIAAALLLTGLLYAFNAEKRSQENGLLLALGFPRKKVRRFVLLESAVIILIGSLLGAAAGVLYNQVILYALKTVWQGAVGTSALQIHVKLSTLLTGAAVGIIFAFCTIWSVTGRQFKQPVTGLQRGLSRLETLRRKSPRLSVLLSISSLIAVIVILSLTKFETGRDAFMFFFTAGILLLVSGTAFLNVLLYRLGKKRAASAAYEVRGKLNLFNIGVRNNIRKPVRSITLTALLACGVFIVFTVGANRVAATKDTEKRESGSGGFALYGESVIPVLYDLNSEKGSRFYGLESINAKGVRYVQFRVKEGDDASCLNLNRVAHPQLLGVAPGELANRGAFTFVKTSAEVDPENPWAVLQQELPGGVVPAVADQTVILWGLGKAVGDTLSYVDEKGETFKIKLVGGLANSIFQGNLIISEQVLKEKYPSLSGYRVFLIDVPPIGTAAGSTAPTGEGTGIEQELSRLMQDVGLDLMPASARLAEFSRVENTYLSIFLMLGSFGLVLGSIGLGIVLWRSVKERQGELALMRAVGFSRKALQKMVLSEYLPVLAAGIFCGISAALIATLPSILTPASGIPYFTIFVLLVIVALNGFVWVYSAARLATKGDLLAALKND